ncbi:MAG TPA: FCD domain-containing protein [Ilumatobacter sp.]|nr:FCD domain-containing protein [Ilumatobacter sp.]
MTGASPLLRPVKDGNTFEQTVERLATAIRMGVVPTGERLPPERDLAEQLGVSRVTLRQAIKALQQVDYVVSTRGRHGGTVVVYDPASRETGDPRRVASRLGADEVLDALSFRSVVEPGAAALAASRQLGDDELARLREALVVVGSAEGQARRIADSQFHILVAALSGSASVAAAVADVQSRLDELLTAIPVFGVNIAHSDAQHKRIARAIARGEVTGARTAMAEHVEGTAALLRGLLA